MLSDSMMPFAGDATETQLPCSPSQMIHTDVAMSTLDGVDKHDAAVEAHVAETKATYD